jgi:TPR repeat protein
MSDRWVCLLMLWLLALAANPGRADAASKVTVARILSGERAVTSATSVTERDMNGKVLRRGIKVGDQLEAGPVRLEVPANVTVVVASGRSTATLQPGSIDTFAENPSSSGRESVTINAGRTTFGDPLSFYHVNAGPVSASHHGSAFSFAVDSQRVTIMCTDCIVEASRARSIGFGHAMSYVEQVDRLSAAGGSSVAYRFGQAWADVAGRLQTYQVAAARGDSDANVNLGSAYFNGNGVSKDYATALHYYQLAAAQSDAAGEVNLGVMYANGYGIPRNYDTAAHYFNLAADQGYAAGENNLGAMYDSGTYVSPANLAARKALQNPSGEVYLEVAGDYLSARSYYLRAAAQGDPAAEFNLGYMYEYGDGRIARDNATALRYYQLAAAQGDPAAISAVARLSKLLKR